MSELPTALETMTAAQLSECNPETLTDAQKKKVKRWRSKQRRKAASAAQATGSTTGQRPAPKAKSTGRGRKRKSEPAQATDPHQFMMLYEDCPPEVLEGPVGIIGEHPISETPSETYITPIEEEFSFPEHWAGPQTAVAIQYDGNYPEGEHMEYVTRATMRSALDEALHLERCNPHTYECLRRGAAVHRQTRRWAERFLKPGMHIGKCVDHIDACNRRLVQYETLQAGMAFPVGMSRNHVAAHYQPNPDDNTLFQSSDVVCVDFGIHVEGWVIDAAFTICWDPQYIPLLEASREATNVGVRSAGIDVRVCDIGAAISEVISSYEVEINGVMKQVKPIENLTGHSVGSYKVHAGKSIPLVDNGDQTKMEEGEIFACETFASTGKGRIISDTRNTSSHFMISAEPRRRGQIEKKAYQLLQTIRGEFSTLAWSHRWLRQLGQRNYLGALYRLIDAGVVDDYPPLFDPGRGCHVSQFEHTFALKPTGKEVFTRCDDY